MYKRIEHNKNKRLVQYIDQLKITTVHQITERSKDRKLVLTFSL